ncbi:hypothetical protein [Streptomyces sp. 6N106]|uniref:hypothetical protein n=1 Tax=Streptomyces sp. 6N106 TaxID=3457418 RepID=UPI003FD669EF
MNRAKRIGTAHETAVADYLNEGLGQYVDNWREATYKWRDPRDPNNITRNVQTGAKDTGDLTLWPFIGEAKNVQKIDLPAFVRQANTEAKNAGADYGVVFVKARGKSVGATFAVMDLETFRRVLADLRSK